MGYNGGTNKRGYYRRNHGMNSKSSMKYGSNFLANIFSGGLELVDALGRSSLGFSSEIPNLEDIKIKHFNPIHQRIKYIIFGIIAILCPILGCILFEFFNWWIFFSVLICGFIETCICLPMTFTNRKNNYIYKDEEQYVKKICRGNLNILRVLFIILFILNLYPFLSHDLYLISYIFVCLKLWVNMDLIRASFKNEINTEVYANVVMNRPATT